MKLSVITIITCYLFVSHQVEIQKIPDYSWKEYRGEVPWSAVRATPDDCNAHIYIGMAWFEAGLLLGNLIPNDTTVRTTGGGKVLITNKHTMILTTQHPLLFSWVPTTSETFDDVKKTCELVVAGVESGRTMNIGRKTLMGTVTVGKIQKYPSAELVLPADNGKKEVKYRAFDVLAYDCKAWCPDLDEETGASHR